MTKPSVTDIRTKGQVWTPRWVADAMASYLFPVLPGNVLDPAVGPGVLFAAVRDSCRSKSRFFAFEIDELVLSKDHGINGFASSEIEHLVTQSFLSGPATENIDAVIANPPYLRHHLIPAELKKRCKELSRQILGVNIDARAGIHVYFLVKALAHLKQNGRLAFLVPADTFEGVFANSLWSGISERFSVDGVLTFDPVVSAFPGVDTNAAIVFISRRKPSKYMNWMKWSGSPNESLAESVSSIFLKRERGISDKMVLEKVVIKEAIRRGMTRDQKSPLVDGVSFNDLASVVRGIATGDNGFFLMTRDQIKRNSLSEEYFVRTVARVRDVKSEFLTSRDLEQLDASGRPTYLLSIDKDLVITKKLRQYLDTGESSGLSERPLVKARSLWYLMEKRKPVPILFCYLGRRNQRFILAKCDVRPTTGFLCVYPKIGVDEHKLQKALNHKSTILQLAQIGKSYGDGAIKVEPGGLRKLIVPNEALIEAELEMLIAVT